MKVIFIFFSIVFLTSCPNQEDIHYTTCNTSNPLEDLTWLKDFKVSFEASGAVRKSKIIQYTYKDETVFLIDNCYDCANNLTTVYNCKGEVICEFGGHAGVDTCPDFKNEAFLDRILYEN